MVVHMYYVKMKTSVRPNFKSKSFCTSKSYILLRKKEISFVDFKFYQKFFVVLFALSTILIIPESPREMENICESYNSKKLCNVW